MEQYISIGVTAVGALIALTNVVVQVLKQIIPNEKFPTNFLAVIVSVVLTLLAVIVYCIGKAIVIHWYVVIGALVLGILVAYGAMFGFDKLKEALKGNIPE